jgi:tRNA threonylcarbamoyladenosine biosynthesis protein TsaE
MKRVLADEAATRAAGAALGAVLAPGDAIGLCGDLGAGKTTFVQGLAAGLGVVAPVVSPTFSLVNEVRGGRVLLVHADLYRIERARELDELGLDEALRGGVCAVVIEWADRFEVLPPDALWIELRHDGDARVLEARGPAARIAAWEAALH